MEQQAELFQTLNNAIKNGLESLPKMAELLIWEYQKYNITASMVGLIVLFVGLYILLFITLPNAKGKDGEVSDYQVGIIISSSMAVIILIFSGIIAFVSHIIPAISPIGSIVNKAIG